MEKEIWPSEYNKVPTEELSDGKLTNKTANNYKTAKTVKDYALTQKTMADADCNTLYSFGFGILQIDQKRKVCNISVAKEKPEAPKPTKYGYGMRHVQSCLLFFCVTVCYMARAHLGVSVVAMIRRNDQHNITNIINIDKTTVNINVTGIELNATGEVIYKNESTDANEVSRIERVLKYNKTLANLVSLNETDTLWNVYRTYEWKKATQEMILSSFFLGYSVAMFPMGMVVQRLGGKIPIQIGLLVNGVVSIVTPTVAVWGGWKAVCACRVLQGISQSGLYPSVHTILAKWVPINERATFVGYVYTGTTFGTIIAFQMGGLLASTAAGWPSSFWVVGATCLVAFALVTVFSAATPDDHKTISDEEKTYITGAAGGSKKMPKTPWKQIFSCKHVWAALVTHFFCGTCFVFLFTQTPTYMHYILGFNIKSSGLLSSLPYIGSFFFAIAYGVLSDYFVNKGFVTLKTTRIVCNTLGQAAPAVCLIAVSYTDNIALAVILIVAAVSLYAGIHTGWMVNYIDLSPNFSGSLMAVGNTVCGAGVLLLPVLVSNIVTELTDRSQWRIVMIIMAGSIFFSNLFYVFFMSTDKQEWDEIIDHEDTETEA